MGGWRKERRLVLRWVNVWTTLLAEKVHVCETVLKYAPVVHRQLALLAQPSDPPTAGTGSLRRSVAVAIRRSGLPGHSGA